MDCCGGDNGGKCGVALQPMCFLGGFPVEQVRLSCVLKNCTERKTGAGVTSSSRLSNPTALAWEKAWGCHRLFAGIAPVRFDTFILIQMPECRG